MSSFHDVVFPLSLAFGASGGPTRKTQITQLASGGEHRNNPHARSRRSYNAAAGVKSYKDLQTLISFFEARRGQLYSFRFKDPIDNLSCDIGETPSATDQVVANGDGSEIEFQIYKNYSDAAAQSRRPITKLIAGTVSVAIDGRLISTDDYVVDPLTGLLLFNSAPDEGAIVSAGYEFHVPVRFGADRLDLSLEAFGAGEITQVPLVEVFDA